VKKILSVVGACWFSLVATAGNPLNRFEAYPVGFADPDTVERMAKAIVGDDGTALVDPKTHRLFVLATEEEHARLKDMVASLSAPPRNVRIEVAFTGRAELREREASISAGGAVVAGGGDVRGRIRIQPKVIDSLSRSSSDVTQTLLVASGREGVLEIGERVPHLEWFEAYAMRHGYLGARVDWQHVGSRLVVEPLIVGDGPTIRVRLTPELSGRVDGQPLRTRFARVATEVVVQSGQSFRIGGLDQDAEFYRRFLVGAGRSGRQEALEITLTPRIEGGAP